MKTSTPSTRSSSRRTLRSSAPCRKASIECCKMLGISSTPSAQTWSPARCSTSSTGSPEALVIADLDERFIHESSASLCVLRWLIGPSVGAGVPVARKRRGAALPSREACRPGFCHPLCPSGGTQRISIYRVSMELVNDLKVRRNEPQCSNLAFKVRSSQKSYGWNRFWSRTFDVKDENLCSLFSSEKCPVA